MKKTVLMLSSVLLLTGTALAQQNAAADISSTTIPIDVPMGTLEIGDELPQQETRLMSVAGEEITLKEQKTDRGLLVMFSCNTCPYVVKAQERTKEMIKYAKTQGIGMVIVNSNELQRGNEDSYEAMQTYAKTQRYTVPYVMDDRLKLANTFGAMRTPEVFLFDGKGALVYKGAMEDNPSEPGKSKQMFLKDAMYNMLAGKPIENATTKSIGCSIKRR